MKEDWDASELAVSSLRNEQDTHFSFMLILAVALRAAIEKSNMDPDNVRGAFQVEFDKLTLGMAQQGSEDKELTAMKETFEFVSRTIFDGAILKTETSQEPPRANSIGRISDT